MIGPLDTVEKSEENSKRLWSTGPSDSRLEAALTFVEQIGVDCANGVVVVDEYRALFILADEVLALTGKKRKHC
jgi:hypothetical protein